MTTCAHTCLDKLMHHPCSVDRASCHSPFFLNVAGRLALPPSAWMHMPIVKACMAWSYVAAKSISDVGEVTALLLSKQSLVRAYRCPEYITVCSTVACCSIQQCYSEHQTKLPKSMDFKFGSRLHSGCPLNLIYSGTTMSSG